MDSTANAASDRVYQDFDPSTEWIREPLADTLKVYLPGFRNNQLKVQITSANNLKISGARQLNDNIWSRFSKEIPIPSNYDANGIGATLEKGILYIRNPKLIVPASPAPESFKPISDQPEKPLNQPQETPKPIKQEPHKTEKPAKEEPSKPLETSKPQETPKSTKEEPHKPSKPLQEPPKPEKTMKLEEPSKPLDAPKSQNPSQETPKPAKEKSSKTEKRRFVEKEHQAMRKRKVLQNADESEQENAGNIEKGERTASGSNGFVMENFKDAISGLVKEMKNARNATNIVVAILFGIVLGLYVRNAVRYFMKSEN